MQKRIGDSYEFLCARESLDGSTLLAVCAFRIRLSKMIFLHEGYVAATASGRFPASTSLRFDVAF